MIGTCSFPGCGRPKRHSGGLCDSHRVQELKGNGLHEITQKTMSVSDRFWSQVDVHEFGSGCWIWLGTTLPDGYGSFFHHGRRVAAHRFSYENVIGPIPSGLQLDHLCRNRRCVRPDHLEPVTCRENVIRGEGLAAKNARKVTCPSGHRYDGINADGARVCRACDRNRWERRKAHRNAVRRAL